MDTIKAILNWIKSAFMVAVNIKKLSDQISELQEQLSSPATYRDALEFMKLEYDETKKVLRDKMEMAIDAKDLEKKKEIQKALDEVDKYEEMLQKLSVKNNQLETENQTLLYGIKDLKYRLVTESRTVQGLSLGEYSRLISSTTSTRRKVVGRASDKETTKRKSPLADDDELDSENKKENK